MNITSGRYAQVMDMLYDLLKPCLDPDAGLSHLDVLSRVEDALIIIEAEQS